VTENSPLGQAPQEPGQPRQPPASPLIARQAFGDAPQPPSAAPGEGTLGAAPAGPSASEAFGIAPGAAPPASQAFGAAPAAAPSEKKKGGIVKIVGAVVAIILALCIAGVILAIRGFGGDPTKDAKAGDCLGELPAVAVGQKAQVTSAKVVACSDPAATYKVAGRVENATEAQASNQSVCAAYPQIASWYSSIPSGGKGYVLCLAKITK
jgi:hypothetical protein